MGLKFEIGEKIVLVKQSEGYYRTREDQLNIGEIVTISKAETDWDGNYYCFEEFWGDWKNVEVNFKSLRKEKLKRILNENN